MNTTRISKFRIGNRFLSMIYGGVRESLRYISQKRIMQVLPRGVPRYPRDASDLAVICGDDCLENFSPFSPRVTYK